MSDGVSIISFGSRTKR